MPRYYYAGMSDLGYGKENQEDFLRVIELDDNTLLTIIADGTQSIEGHVKPATLVTLEIIDYIQRIKNKNKELLFSYPKLFLEEALLYANKLLGAFKMGNEEMYAGYAVSLTVCLFFERGKERSPKFAFAHTGNTRMYIIRGGGLRQVTKDQTKAAELFREGLIKSREEYHTHPDRLVITGGLGFTTAPVIQTGLGTFKEDDIFLFTTDGIHYAINEDALIQLIIEGQIPSTACANLIEGSVKAVKYPDNATCCIVINGEKN